MVRFFKRFKIAVIFMLLICVSVAFALWGNRQFAFGHHRWLINTILGLPQVATSNLPAASSYESAITYDSTANVVKYSDGSSWNELGTFNPITVSTGNYAMPFVVTVVDTGINDSTQIFLGNAPFKFQIIDAWAISTKASNSGTWKLANGANDITSAVDFGTGDNDISRAAEVNDAYDDITTSDTLWLLKSVDTDKAIVYISAIRIN